MSYNHFLHRYKFLIWLFALHISLAYVLSTCLGKKNQFNSDFLPLKRSAFHTLMHNSLSKPKFFGFFVFVFVLFLLFFFELMGGRAAVKIHFLWVISRIPWLDLFWSRWLSWHRYSAEVSEYRLHSIGKWLQRRKMLQHAASRHFVFLYLYSRKVIGLF